MKKFLAVFVIAAAMTTACNNSGVEAPAAAAPTKAADSAAKAAPDTLKAAAPADSSKVDSTKK
jgi:hypothetical protein